MTLICGDWVYTLEPESTVACRWFYTKPVILTSLLDHHSVLALQMKEVRHKERVTTAESQT